MIQKAELLYFFIYSICARVQTCASKDMQLGRLSFRIDFFPTCISFPYIAMFISFLSKTRINFWHPLAIYFNCSCLCSVGRVLAPVVQKLDRAIHWINHYTIDKYQVNQWRYQVDSVIHLLNIWGMVCRVGSRRFDSLDQYLGSYNN